MIDEVQATLHVLREASRRSTLVCTFALAAGVIMIPLSYRGGMTRLDRWMLLGAGIVYVGAAAIRVARGLATERQLDAEERFVRSARRDGINAPVKIGRPSALVQAVRRAQSAPTAERRRALRLAVRRGTQALTAPPGSMAVPALIVLGGLWIRVAVVTAGQRGYPLFLAVTAVLAVLLVLETYLFLLRRRLRTELSVLTDRVVAWWSAEQAVSGDPSFSHEIVYRDVADRLGLA